MTACPDREATLQALIDGELDAANAAETEAHMATCSGCTTQYRAMTALRERLSETAAERAPPGLKRRVEAALAAEVRRPSWLRRPGPAWAAAGAMSGAAAALVVIQLAAAPPMLEAQLVASHIRSLQADHLVDVATSDRHVVRPWFNGRVDFAPPTPDLAAQGFPLIGGRLDYVGGRAVAAIVYRRNTHVINLFVAPAQAEGWRLPFHQGPQPGYAVRSWREGGLEFWAVSDAEPRELDAFHHAFDRRPR